ncbi:trypsin-like peptidase domain-containing protein [Streptomyces sp. NPDC020412]|uniref:trypsin-like peptidase domain-containing protein n=1 Tax=Streptomyces sp. NPDC020412 TaxID=3365073 RepID=UPI0037AB7123
MSTASGSGPRPGADAWVVAVHGAEEDDTPFGSGFLIDDRRVVTCAHVVCPAWDRGAPLWVAFPKSDRLLDRRIRVERVAVVERPPKRDVQDVAVLTLAERVGEQPARLRRPQPGALVGEAWWSFGFPDGDVFGNSADGTVGEALGYGWIRLDTQSRYPVKSGYSGAALWSDTYRAVVGIVGQANRANGDARALTLHHADRFLPGEELGLLTEWSAEAAGEGALAAWGWTLAQDPEGERHWRPRARGVSSDAERGFRFRGRTAALSEIVAWLTVPTAQRHVLVVTGSPGVGKSSVLGRVVTSADPEIAATLPTDDEAVRAPVGTVSCAVHAKGKTALEVAHEIARAASAELPATVADLAPAIRLALADRAERATAAPRPFTVVIDALDEATNPTQARQIATRVALPLAETCADLQVRVMIGSRRRDDAGDLLAAFGRAAHTIDLDSPAYFAEADLAAYARATLQLLGDERPDTPYADDAAARPVAARIAAIADGNFLVAGLIARSHGMHDREAVPAASIDFPPTVAAALHEYLARVPAVDGVPAAAVLTALAYAEAPGLPLSLWRTAVAALGAGEPAEEALRTFVRSSAANFLVETGTADGRGRVFRLFHQALNDALRQARHDCAASPAADERALVRAFLAHGRERGWARAPAYLLRSLPGHAVRGDAVDALLADDAFPLHADLRRLIAAGVEARTPKGRERAELLRLTLQAMDATPARRTALLSVVESQHRLGETYRRIDGPSPYRADWAEVAPSAEVAVLEGHTDYLAAIRTLTVDGDTYVIGMSSDGGLWVWEAVSARLVSTAKFRGGWFLDLCPVFTDGHPMLALAHEYGVLLADPFGELAVQELPGDVGALRALCTVDADGRTLLAGVSEDTTVALWDPATRRLVRVLRGHARRITALCAVPRAGGGPTMLASADDGGLVILWDPGTGKAVHFLETAERVTALYRVVVGGDTFVACGGPYSLLMWAPFATPAATPAAVSGGAVSGSAVWAVDGLAHASQLLCSLELAGRPVLASADAHAPAIGLRAADTGELTATVPLPPDVHMLSLHPVETHGRTLLASLDLLDTVRLWDPTIEPAEHATAVPALCAVPCDDAELVASAPGDGQWIQVRNATDGRAVWVFPTRFGQVRALCPITAAGRPLLAAASGRGRWQVRDAETGRLVSTGPHGSFVDVRALCAPEVGGVSLLAVAGGESVHLYDPLSGAWLRTLESQRAPGTNGFNGLCVLPDADRPLIAASPDFRGGSIHVWDPLTGVPEPFFAEGESGVLHALVAVPLGDRTLLAATADDKTVRLWNVADRSYVGTLHGHLRTVSAVTPVSVSGRPLLASTGRDRTVRLWDLDTLSQVMEIPLHHSGQCLAWVGGRLVVGLDRGIQTLVF